MVYKPPSSHAYNKSPGVFARQYEALKFEEVHADLLDLLPAPGAWILDVGAGSGRDAAALALLGYRVVAVEPAGRLKRLASQLHQDSRIMWISDALPNLNAVGQLRKSFSFILLSAVWMHIPPRSRRRALRTLTLLLGRDAILAITLRIGKPDCGRKIFEVSECGLITMTESMGLRMLRINQLSKDKFNRSDVTWSTLAFQKQ